MRPSKNSTCLQPMKRVGTFRGFLAIVPQVLGLRDMDPLPRLTILFFLSSSLSYLAQSEVVKVKMTLINVSQKPAKFIVRGQSSIAGEDPVPPKKPFEWETEYDVDATEDVQYDCDVFHENDGSFQESGSFTALKRSNVVALVGHRDGEEKGKPVEVKWYVYEYGAFPTSTNNDFFPKIWREGR